MKIGLRILPTPGARQALTEDQEFAAAVDVDQIAFVLDGESDPFARLLDVTRDTSGARFFPVLEFENNEIAATALCEPQCRKVARETDRDYRLNNERMKAQPPRPGTEELPSKLLDGISLTRPNLKPMTIAGVGEWTTEYVAGTDVVERFVASGLTGLETRPVANPRTKENHEDCWQLFAESAMPPLVRDGSLRLLRAEKGPEVSLAQLGCLTYPKGTSERALDFNRTAEPFTFFGGPQWVLSSRVREVYERSGMKGWDFLPVLEEGTALHREFTMKWGRLRERVGANPNNVL